MTAPDDIVDEARTWVGTPWHHQGRLKGVGVDCGGLIIGVAAALGLPPVETTPPDYKRRGPRAAFEAACDARFERDAQLTFEAGRVVAFYLGNQGHLGILVPGPEGLRVVHANATRGIRKVVDVTFDHVLAPRVFATYRLRGLAP